MLLRSRFGIIAFLIFFFLVFPQAAGARHLGSTREHIQNEGHHRAFGCYSSGAGRVRRWFHVRRVPPEAPRAARDVAVRFSLSSDGAAPSSSSVARHELPSQNARVCRMRVAQRRTRAGTKTWLHARAARGSCDAVLCISIVIHKHVSTH